MAAPDDRTPSDETWVPDAAAAPGPAVDLLATRYRLGSFLGGGAIGQVYRARDVLLDVDVAVKIMRPAGRGTERQIRRELLALRVLSVPGVAQLRDDGMHLGQRFLVMDVLPGGPFDRLAARGPWHTWAAQAQALLETLARVHFAGIVHRDLKPANILLDARDQPVITDFGLAQGELVEAVVGTREGTPRYMAPEQARGEPCDARADLYAVGVMFAEMVGDGPVPPEVAAVIAAMRAPNPADRPATALDALRELGADADRLVGARLAVSPATDAAALRPLFDEPPESFLRVAHDAAEVLFARTGGEPAAVRAEVERWVRLGRCQVVGAKVQLERAAVDKLLWEDSPEAAALTEASREADERRLGEELLAAAAALQRRGRNQRALALLDIGLKSLEPQAPQRGEVLERLVCAAVALADEDALRLAQHRAERMGAAGLARLAEGVRARGRGQAERAAELLSRELSGEPELWRVAQLVLALRDRDPPRTAALLARGEVLCGGDPMLTGRWHVWCSNADYASGRFAAAIDHGRRALALLTEPTVFRLMALTNTALATLEGFDLTATRSLAAAAHDLAITLRHAHAEALATWLSATVAYRVGEDDRSVEAFIQPAGPVSRRLQAQFCILEAAWAWRRGDRETSVSHALEAARGFDGSLPAGAALARALARCAGGPGSLDDERVVLGRLSGPMQLEALALLVAGGAVAPPPEEVWRPLADAWPTADDRLRVNVLTRAECLRMARQG